MIDWGAIEAEAAGLLSRYIQCNTSNPPGNEAVAIEFLADILAGRGFTPRVLESAPGRANLIVRLPGRGDSLAPPCLLYAHADVVPADPAGWKFPPFAGQVNDGFVWGRGALDDKGLGIIFLEALSLLKEHDPPLGRDIILVIAADEETCGHYGISWLLDHHSDLLQAEYAWDEGGLGLRQVGKPDCLYAVAVAEKGTLTVKLIASGSPGHASTPQLDSSPDRLVRALTRVQRWRQPARLTDVVRDMLVTLAPGQPFPRSFLFARAGQSLLWPWLQAELEKDPLFAPLIANTVNLTLLRAGEKSNVVPAQSEATLDIRLLPGENLEAFLAQLRSVIADPAVTVQVGDRPTPHQPTSPRTPFFHALAEVLTRLGPPGPILPYLNPGATDSRFFRRAGIQAYGFVPMLLDSFELSRIHGIDERVSTANLRWGVQVVYETLKRL